VHRRSRSVAGCAVVDDQHAAARAAKGERSRQAGGATTDDEDIDLYGRGVLLGDVHAVLLLRVTVRPIGVLAMALAELAITGTVRDDQMEVRRVRRR
jgi:hypothetical protein